LAAAVSVDTDFAIPEKFCPNAPSPSTIGTTAPVAAAAASADFVGVLAAIVPTPPDDTKLACVLNLGSVSLRITILLATAAM
jgi:hypothetical protein